MIRINQNIRYQNVLTKKVFFHYTEMKKELENFLNAVQKTGATINGPLTYALYNVPTDENMLVEFILQVEQDDVQAEELDFQSYYSVENMVSIHVFGNYDTQMEYAYASLIEFLNQAALEIVTPIFHVVDPDKKYIEVKIGYRKRDN